MTLVRMDRGVRDVVRMSASVANAVRSPNGVTVRRADPMHVVATDIVAMTSPAVAAGEAEEGHGGHAGGSENHAEEVEVHLQSR